MSYQPAAYRSTNTLAVVSLIAGIASWTVLPFVAAVIAIVCGHLARKEIRLAPPGTVEGDSLAVIGMVMGYLQLALIVLAMLLFFIFAALGIGLLAHFFPWHG
ncbi:MULTISPECIES: DUF4190 domain-containing protein [unclassified Dyella]|uniref:DUF4190 domain-containing protein n=1 Tax=unclassified Dyella TaxID=2634549 RepID=UPI003F93347F